jgi:hypothetical protein
MNIYQIKLLSVFLLFLVLWFTIVFTINKSYFVYKWSRILFILAVIIMCVITSNYKKLAFFLVVFISVILIFSICFFYNNRNYYKRLANKYERCQGFDYKVYKKLGVKTNKNYTGIISCSLYGDSNKPGFKQKYLSNISKNANKVKEYMPDWVIRVYVAKNMHKDIIAEFLACDMQVFIMNNESIGHQGSLWRYLPAGENLPWLAIDMDDVIYNRMGEWINSWLESNKPFIVITDYQLLIPLSGKLWGSKPNEIPNISELINNHCQTWFGTDEAFLRKEIWPIVYNKGYWSPPIYKQPLILLVSIIPVILLAIITLFLSRYPPK